MADINITSLQRAVQTSTQVARSGHGEEAATAQRTTVADQVQLSAEAKRRLDELTQGQTIAEAFLKHVLDSRLKESAGARTDQDLEDEEAQKQVASALDRLTLDLGWLVEALGIPPEEGDKLRAVLSARANLDYVQSRPPVPEIIVRARAEEALPTVFVRELAFEVGKDGISSPSVQQVAVTHANPSLAQQLGDPNAPRVIVMDDRQSATSEEGRKAFESTLQLRLMSQPHPELQGLLIVRENAATGDRYRLRIDALMPL